MYYANYHTHTVRCGHASGTEREFIEAAIEAGITVLGFADHSPQVFKNGYISAIRMKPEDVGEYVATIRDLADEYKDDIEIYAGFEAEYFPEIFDGLYGLCKTYDLDYIIMGQHYLAFPGGLTFEYIGFSEPMHTLKSYVDTVIGGMETGCFSYVAHPDVFYNKGIGDEEYCREMKRLCLRAKELDIPLEVNKLGLTDNRYYPSDRFFNIAKETGNKLIVGVDAHVPSHFNVNEIRATCDFAKKFGLEVINEVKMLHPWRES